MLNAKFFEIFDVNALSVRLEWAEFFSLSTLSTNFATIYGSYCTFDTIH